MPHAERDTMGEPLVNGEKPHSQFISVSYTDVIARMNTNPFLLAPHLLPRRLRLHHNLQKQQIRCHLPQIRRPRLRASRKALPTIPLHSLRLRRTLRRQGRLARRPGSNQSRRTIPHRQGRDRKDQKHYC
jgi:hypothetical protein